MEQTITISSLPTGVSELQGMDGADLKSPFKVAALSVAVLCHYEKDVDETIRMLNVLKGPQPLSNYEISFLRDRLGDKLYLPRSFFGGATPGNNYTPSLPLTVTVKDNPYSYRDEGYATLYLHSGGADSDRPIRLRTKPSTGEWFVWEIQYLSGIVPPQSENAWA